jgi:hypothetical protein
VPRAGRHVLLIPPSSAPGMSVSRSINGHRTRPAPTHRLSMSELVCTGGVGVRGSVQMTSDSRSVVNSSALRSAFARTRVHDGGIPKWPTARWWWSAASGPVYAHLPLRHRHPRRIPTQCPRTGPHRPCPVPFHILPVSRRHPCTATFTRNRHTVARQQPHRRNPRPSTSRIHATHGRAGHPRC